MRVPDLATWLTERAIVLFLRSNLWRGLVVGISVTLGLAIFAIELPFWSSP